MSRVTWCSLRTLCNDDANLTPYRRLRINLTERHAVVVLQRLFSPVLFEPGLLLSEWLRQVGRKFLHVVSGKVGASPKVRVAPNWPAKSTWCRTDLEVSVTPNWFESQRDAELTLKVRVTPNWLWKVSVTPNWLEKSVRHRTDFVAAVYSSWMSVSGVGIMPPWLRLFELGLRL